MSYSVIAIVVAIALATNNVHSFHLQERQSSTPISNVPASAWKSLNTSVGGRLSIGLPLAYPCFNNYNGKSKAVNTAQCSAIEKQDGNTFSLESVFGGYENGNWAQCQATGAGCAISASQAVGSTPGGHCVSGSVSNYYINVSSSADVQHGLAFAQKWAIPLVVKNSGHDYKGRSSGPNSLALWMHYYTPAMTLATGFVPAGCSSPVGTVVTYGAGQGFDGIYEFANANQVTIIGGNSPTVGASGGWITGAGHSPISNTYGLGVDNAQQIKAVLPNGTLVTASRCQNTDMFFALRGGGGGTFGVIMEMTALTHPIKPIQHVSFVFPAMNTSTLLQFMEVIVQNANAWASDGFGGYLLPSVSRQQSRFDLFSPSITLVQAKTAMKPMTAFLASYFKVSQVTAKITTAASYYDIYKAEVSYAGGGAMALSSRLLPSEYFTGATNQSATAKALANWLETTRSGDTDPNKPLLICVTTPSSYTLPASDQPGGPGASAVSPAWRTSPWHIIYTRAWDVTDTTAGGAGSVAQAFQDVYNGMQPLRRMAPNGGAYINEADTFEPDPIDTFWGAANYQRLLSIKREVDPNNVLTCHQCVGWNSTDPRYGCYPAAPS